MCASFCIPSSYNIATSALRHPRDHNHQIACRPGTSVSVGIDKRQLAPTRGYAEGGPFVPSRWSDDVLSASERCLEAKECRHSSFRLFCFKLHTADSSMFHNKQLFISVPLGKSSTKRTPNLSQNTVHMILLRLSAWTFGFRRTSMFLLQRLLFWLRCDMGHQCLISCQNMAQHIVSFFVVTYQKCQNMLHISLCSSVSILRTQGAHNFW